MSETLSSGIEVFSDAPIAEELALTPTFDIRPLVAEYAKADIQTGFDWESAMESARNLRGIQYGQKLYLLDFTSRIRTDISQELYDRLLIADENAIYEAKAIREDGYSGLLSYFAGIPDKNNDCRSFCLWTDYASVLARLGEAHKIAMTFAPDVYEPGSVKFTPYEISQAYPGAPVVFEDFIKP